MRTLLTTAFVGLLAISPLAAKTCDVDGDVNGDGVFDFGDPKALLDYLLLGGPTPRCLSQADANEDGSIDIADAVFMADLLACAAAPIGDIDGSGTLAFRDVRALLEYLFLGGPPPVPCLAVADVNGDGDVNIADPIALIPILPCPPLLAGDADGDEELDTADIELIGAYLFSGGPSPVPCVLAGDANEDGQVDISDMVFLGTLVGDLACGEATVGDVDGNGSVNQGDVAHLLAYLFEGGPDPVPCLAVADVNGDGDVDIADAIALAAALPCPPDLAGDANSDGRLDLADLVRVVGYLFGGGPAPIPCDLAGDINQDGRLDIADVIGYFELF